MLTPSERRTRARVAAFALHAMGGTNTGPATAAQLARFDRLVDPSSSLPPEERAKRARAALRSHMSALSLKASQARRKKTPAVEKPGVFAVEVRHDRAASQ